MQDLRGRKARRINAEIVERLVYNVPIAADNLQTADFEMESMGSEMDFERFPTWTKFSHVRMTKKCSWEKTFHKQSHAAIFCGSAERPDCSISSEGLGNRNGCSISLGTVGTERHWRNMQRRCRNLARSCAKPDTVDTLNLFRWLSEVRSRLSKLRLTQHGRLDTRMWLLSASQRLASILVQGPSSLA